MDHTKKSNGFATASLVLAIIALLSAFTMTMLPPVFFGCLSIILGLLSRGGEKKLANNALAGVAISAGALVMNLAILATSFFIVFSNPEATDLYWQKINETYEQMTGMDFNEFIESYGIDADRLGIPSNTP